MKPETAYYFRSHNVERGTASERNPRIGYRWCPGYSEAIPGGGTVGSFTRREASQQAKSEGKRARYFATEQDARTAIEASQ